MRKAEVNMMVVMLLLAMLLFLAYSFMTKGVVYRFLEGISPIQDDAALRANCIAPPGSPDDKNNDGFLDSKVGDYECDKIKKSNT